MRTLHLELQSRMGDLLGAGLTSVYSVFIRRKQVILRLSATKKNVRIEIQWQNNPSYAHVSLNVQLE